MAWKTAGGCSRLCAALTGQQRWRSKFSRRYHDMRNVPGSGLASTTEETIPSQKQPWENKTRDEQRALSGKLMAATCEALGLPVQASAKDHERLRQALRISGEGVLVD